MRRILAAVAVAALSAGAGSAWHSVVSHAATLCQPNQPTVTQVAPTSAAVGGVITVTGQNLATLSQSGCSVAVVIEDATHAQPGFPQFAPSDDSGSTLHFTLTAPASGPLRILITGPDGSVESPQSLNLFTNPTAGGLPSSPHVGDALKATGTGLQLGGQEAGAALSYAPIAGHCPAPPSPVALSDTEVDVPALTSYCQMSVSLSLTPWSDAAHTSQLPAFTLSMGTVDVAPTLSNGSLQSRALPAGSQLTLNGTGLGFSGTATVGGEATSASFNDTAVSLRVPDDAVNNAPVTATRSDGVQLPVSGGIGVDARVDALSPNTAAVGDAVTIIGGGFGHDAGTVSIGSSTFPVRSWSATSITVTVPPGATGGVPGIQPRDTGPPASAPSLAIVPRITGVTPSHAAPGAAFEVVGSSFGQPQSGDGLRVGGVPAAVSLWSDTQIVASVPSGLSAGETSVAVSIPGAPGAITTTLTVDPPVAAPGGPAAAQPGTPARSTPAATPGIIPPAPGGPIVTTHAPAFSKPVPQPGAPVTVTLSAPTTETAAGGQVPLSVTVTAFGKPAAGVTVSFLLVVVPGGDAALSQPSAVTDQQGRASVLLHLSRTAGDTIVLARAGQYQDEIRVVGSGAGTAPAAVSGSTGDGAGSPALSAAGGSPQRLLIVGLLLICLVLFLSGFAIQLRSSAGGAASVTSSRPGSGGRVVEATRAGGAVLQFAAAIGIALVGRVVGRIRRCG